MTKPLLTAATLALSLIAALPVRAESPFGALAASREPAAPTPPSRDFDSADRLRALRLAITTLQDLGLALEAADAETGTITASRLEAHPLRLTVTITAKSDTQITATITTDYAGTQITDPTAATAFLTHYESTLSPPPEID